MLKMALVVSFSNSEETQNNRATCYNKTKSMYTDKFNV